MDLNDREHLAPHRGARDDSDPQNIVHLLNNQQLGLNKRRSPKAFKQFAELKASRSQLQETHCVLPTSARSTFLMSFSHDCTKIASTHGDHNIYVSEMKTGRPLVTLEGHPRTPWCIAFHPTSNDILASGCLAGEVRVWDLRGGGSERWRADHDQVIASLAFHPTEQLLVIATGNSLYFWNWSNPAPVGHCSTNSDLERVRYVKFDPFGYRIITGIANRNSSYGLFTNNLTSTPPFSPQHSHHYQNPRDSDMYRTSSRRSVMERIMNVPEPETLRRQPSRTTSSRRSNRNVASSSSSAGNNAGTSGETNRSRLRRVENESRPRRDTAPSAAVSGSDRSSAVGRSGYFFGNPAYNAGTTVRRSPEDNLDTASSISSIPAERSSSVPLFIDRRGNLHFRNNVETSTDHQNNSLSDHDYSSESNVPQSRVNNESFNNSEPSLSARNTEEDFDYLQRVGIELSHGSETLEQRMARALLQIQETFQPTAGPSQSNEGSRVLQSNEISEPTAGPSQNDGEVYRPGAGLPQSDGRSRIRDSAELDFRNEDSDDEDGNQSERMLSFMSDLRLNLELTQQRMLSNQVDLEELNRAILNVHAVLLPEDVSYRALNDPLTQDHRIQIWDFTSGEFPPIYNATANVVVRRCMIHNDASVDISQDGERLVALIPPEDRDLSTYLMFGVFSLRRGHLGKTLCIWGYISNAISVSFSPLAQYVVVGSAYSRPIYSNPEKAPVAQIIRINKYRDSYDASYIRSFTQVIDRDNRFSQVSLNCVKWLPIPGLGIAYATNRGCLCICKPIAGEMFENVPNEPAPELERRG